MELLVIFAMLLMVFGLGTVGMVGVGAASAALDRRLEQPPSTGRKPKNRVRECVEALGLTYDGVNRFSDQRSGLALRVERQRWSGERGRRTRVVWQLPMAAGLWVRDRRSPRVRRRFGQPFHIGGETAAAELLFAGHQALWDQARRFGQISLLNDRLVLTLEGDVDLLDEEHLELGTRLAVALVDSLRGPWRRVAERHGLQLSKSLARIEGIVRGHSVLVAKTDDATLVRVRFAERIDGLAIRKRRGRRAREVSVDPVLDQALSMQGSSELLASALRDEEVRVALLELCHGLGARVDAAGIEVMLPGHALDSLEGALNGALTLADALTGGPRLGVAEAEPARRVRRQVSE